MEADRPPLLSQHSSQTPAARLGRGGSSQRKVAPTHQQGQSFFLLTSLYTADAFVVQNEEPHTSLPSRPQRRHLQLGWGGAGHRDGRSPPSHHQEKGLPASLLSRPRPRHLPPGWGRVGHRDGRSSLCRSYRAVVVRIVQSSQDSIVHQTDVEFWRFNQPRSGWGFHSGEQALTCASLDVSQRAQPRDETSVGHYDFSYLSIDFSNNFKGGYAFVNFCKPEHITSSVQRRVGHPWGMYGSLKKCEVSYATIQGFATSRVLFNRTAGLSDVRISDYRHNRDYLLAKFHNSVVMEETPAFRPKLWYNTESADLPTDEQTGFPDYRAIGIACSGCLV
ncbi:hypothetical protein E4T42_04727 [Aureobasidium subglaciale]|nr:hypothetical protein E4T42_04727 [Aureobasidium subglaciale]